LSSKSHFESLAKHYFEDNLKTLPSRYEVMNAELAPSIALFPDASRKKRRITPEPMLQGPSASSAPTAATGLEKDKFAADALAITSPMIINGGGGGGGNTQVSFSFSMSLADLQALTAEAVAKASSLSLSTSQVSVAIPLTSMQLSVHSSGGSHPTASGLSTLLSSSTSTGIGTASPTRKS
jgi:hypothetical protein